MKCLDWSTEFTNAHLYLMFGRRFWRNWLQLGGAMSGWLYVSNGKDVRWTASSKEARTDLQPLMESGGFSRSERLKRLLRTKQTGFVPCRTLYSSVEEMRNDPAYRDICTPAAWGGARESR